MREGGEYIGVGTNNRAEYTAVLLALQAAVDVATPDSKLDFKIDSLMVVSELNGTYKVRNRELWPLHEQILALTKKFKKVTFTHIPREQNTAADAQVNKILNAHGA